MVDFAWEVRGFTESWPLKMRVSPWRKYYVMSYNTMLEVRSKRYNRLGCITYYLCDFD